MPDPKQELEEEVARLRARVSELENELNAETKKRKGSSKASQTRNISKRATDEGGSIVRGVALAGVELVRSTGNVLASFADTVSDRNRPEEKGSSSDLTRDLPKDIASGALNAIEQALEIPGRMIDKLHEGYRETREA
jgi:hypothetical protein